MAGYLANDMDMDNDFEYDGRPYRFEPEYTDEDLEERRMQIRTLQCSHFSIQVHFQRN